MLEYKFDCWNLHQSLNNDHLTIHNELKLNSSKTFINVRELPKNPNLYWWSTSRAWQLYMNYLDVNLERMFTYWDPKPDGSFSHNWWVGNPKGFKEGATKDGEKFSDFSKGCKQMGIIPIYCIGSSEENIPDIDWLGRSPTRDKWQWLGRFCKEFAIYVHWKYGFKKAVLEIWNEPAKAFDPIWYSSIGAYMAKGWKSANLGYEVWINSNDFVQQGWFDGLLSNSVFPNLAMYSDAITFHCNSTDEWNQANPNYFQIVKNKLANSVVAKKYNLNKIIVSELSPQSGLNNYTDMDPAQAQLKTFSERLNFIKENADGYGLLFVFKNDIIYTANMDEILSFLLYDRPDLKALSGTIIGKNQGKYDFIKTFNS